MGSLEILISHHKEVLEKEYHIALEMLTEELDEYNLAPCDHLYRPKTSEYPPQFEVQLVARDSTTSKSELPYSGRGTSWSMAFSRAIDHFKTGKHSAFTTSEARTVSYLHR